jgi:TetR/AcrR family transcriptional regulator, tetracycline repressor protein
MCEFGPANLVLRDITPDIDPGSWKDYLRALIHRCRAAIRRHPNAAPLLGAQLTGNTRADLGLVEGILRALTHAGFEGAMLVNAYNATIATLVGFATQEYAPMPESGDDWQTQIRERLDHINAEEFPLVAGNLPLLKNRSFILR